jgi:1-deoxy-D-xylulose-5-phosphate reductoisomerase
LKRVSIFGSTGVVGKLGLAVVSDLSSEWQVATLSAGQQMDVLAEQIRIYHPEYVSVGDEAAYRRLLEEFDGALPCDVGIGDHGLVAAANVSSDLVLTAIVGAKGLIPTWTAMARGARIGLANKETLVAAGHLVMEHARRHKAEIIPVDSEHSAVFQSLLAGRRQDVASFWVTASGGPFREWPKVQIEQASRAEALRHPNWKMGEKITVDSASMMNKGFEVIEAHHLFGAPYDKIKVLVHPQSIVHSLVEYEDGAVLAELATHDMRIPVQYAFTYPERRENRARRLTLQDMSCLTFEEPDMERFPCLRLAYQAGVAGDFATCVVNAANEVVVAAFLAGRVRFGRIPEVIEEVLSVAECYRPQSLDDILYIDANARALASRVLDS